MNERLDEGEVGYWLLRGFLHRVKERLFDVVVLFLFAAFFVFAVVSFPFVLVAGWIYVALVGRDKALGGTYGYFDNLGAAKK